MCILHVMWDTKLMSNLLHECITCVDQGLNYDIRTCAHIKLVNDLRNLSNNFSTTHDIKFKLNCTTCYLIFIFKSLTKILETYKLL